MPQVYKCSNCLQTKDESQFHLRPVYTKNGRPVSYHCKECKSHRDRKNETWKAQFKKHKAICQSCNLPRSLATDTQCKQCLRLSGLIRCNKCQEVKLAELEFVYSKKTCDSCCADSPEFQEFMTKKAGKDIFAKQRSAVDSALKARYNITLEEYESLEAKQGGLCAICKSKAPKRMLAVDKPATDQPVRGLLCSSCCTGLKSFGESPAMIEQALKYLLKQ